MISYWVDYTYDVLRQNNLDKWNVEVSRGKRTVGLCNYRSKTIYLSKYHIECDPHSEIEDTVYHEVAHALTPGNGHNHTWRAKAIELGGTGRQYATPGDYPSKWVGMCANGHTAKLYRWNKKSVYNCVPCGSLLYIKLSTGDDITLGASYVRTFNYLAKSQGLPLIDHHGIPLL